MEITVKTLKRIFQNYLLITYDDGKKYIGKVVSYNSYPGQPEQVSRLNLVNEQVPLFSLETERIQHMEELTDENPFSNIAE